MFYSPTLVNTRVMLHRVEPWSDILHRVTGPYYTPLMQSIFFLTSLLHRTWSSICGKRSWTIAVTEGAHRHCRHNKDMFMTHFGSLARRPWLILWWCIASRPGYWLCMLANTITVQNLYAHVSRTVFSTSYPWSSWLSTRNTGKTSSY